MQHGFGQITLADGTIKKGKFEYNQYISEVKDNTKRPISITESPEKEDEEEIM